ncbi:transmembrane protein 223 [Nomia melanderi]|uniref:transmembrane protein 223 n=1 Tax=Nomia melanderi TaxID=2448451 RepID=UPI003FCEAB74
MFNSLYFKNNCINTHVINKLQFFYQRLKKNDKFIEFATCKPYHSFSRSINKITNLRNVIQQPKVDRKYSYININIQNDIFLFKFETNYFKNIRWILLAALTSSAVTCYTSYDPKLKSLLFKDISWSQYIKTCGTNIIFFTFGIFIGPVAVILLYFISQRFIKYLILNKGGNEVTMVTYHLFKEQKILKVPVNKIQANISRHEMKTYLPLKIKDKKFFFLLDNGGTFYNKDLFDNTVGFAKKW